MRIIINNAEKGNIMLIIVMRDQGQGFKVSLFVT